MPHVKNSTVITVHSRDGEPLFKATVTGQLDRCAVWARQDLQSEPQLYFWDVDLGHWYLPSHRYHTAVGLRFMRWLTGLSAEKALVGAFLVLVVLGAAVFGKMVVQGWF